MNKRIAFASILAFLILGLFAFRSFQNPKVAHSSFEILVAKDDYLKYYDPDELNKIKQALTQNLQEKGGALGDFPYVEKAIVQKSLSSKTKVKVFLQRPSLVFNDKNTYKLVNFKGEVFAEIPQYKLPDVPLVRGKKFYTEKNRRQILEVMKSLPSEGVVSQKSMSEVFFDKDFAFIFSGVGGKVYFGEKDFDKKVERLEKVIRYLRFHGLSSKEIDLRYKNRVIVALTDGSLKKI